MATYTVSDGHRAMSPWTLTAGQVDTVTFVDNIGSVGPVEIINSGDVDAWVTVDGSTPAVPAAHVSSSALRVPAKHVLEVNLTGSKSLKIVASAATEVSVQKRA